MEGTALLSKVAQEIIKKGVTVAKNKFGEKKVKKAYKEMQKEGFDFQDVVKGKGAFKDFKVKDLEALGKYGAKQERKAKKQKERKQKIKDVTDKVGRVARDVKDIPLSHVVGAGVAAEGGRRVLEKSAGGAVNKRKSIDGIAIKGFTRAKHR